MGEAIATTTATDDTLRFDHVALFVWEKNTPCVIEAVPERGVVLTPWEEFLTTSPRGVVVMRLLIPYNRQATIRRARTHLGETYDWSFQPDNGKCYCSELITESFVNEAGELIFPLHPMNFRDSTGEIPLFWLELFEKLGESIPEGVLGSNPSDLSCDPRLKIVWRNSK